MKLSSNFKVFIKNSRSVVKNCPENITVPDIIEITVNDNVPKSLEKVLNNLEILTRENKIIWHKDFDGFLSGIVMKVCGLSNYKIFIEDSYSLDINDQCFGIMTDLEPTYRINLVKDEVSSKNIEYLINIMPDNDAMITLLETIEEKLLQQSN